jgi:uncharacterized protein
MTRGAPFTRHGEFDDVDSGRPHQGPLEPESAMPFRPASWLRNPHLATVWGKFFRTPPVVESRTERWDTPDGDMLDIVRTPGDAGSPTFLLLHGLEGGPRSHYVAGMLHRARAAGWQANLLVFRTCNGALNRARRTYHSGETTDLAFVVKRLADERPDAPIVLAGVSLGGNVLLKWLGELGAGEPSVGEHAAPAGIAAVSENDALRQRIAASVAISAPFDLARSCAHIDGAAVPFYSRNFLRSLKRKALGKIAQYPDLADPVRVANADSLWAFDDAFTAVAHGFVDAADYYFHSSSIRLMHRIGVPTLLLNARDDPFHPPDLLEDVARIAAQNPNLHLELTERGGHVGFVEGPHPGRASYYIERRIVAFATNHLTQSRI